ncbi:MAG TPA: cupin domain-containing protein [Trebonia sp.]|nr:cupin domain-containing protein [Trebonia sp.]
MTAAAVRAPSMRRTETPNAVMTTLASPTQGSSGDLSMWKIAMEAGQQGPRHVFDREQVWHVLAGEVDFTVGGDTVRLSAGDAVVLPGAVERQVSAATAAEIIACGPSTSRAAAAGETQSRGTPPWIS